MAKKKMAKMVKAIAKKPEVKEKPSGVRKPYPKGKKAQEKTEKVMHEFKEGELHSGSKTGPKVKNRKQAIAIALSESRKANKKNK